MNTSTTRSRIIALARTDLQVAARDGEQLLLTLGLPILLLVFFSKVDIVPTGDGEPVDFLAPGIISLALLSVAYVRLAIGLGFDRGFGAIKRLAITPLRVNEFLVAKLATTVVLFGVQLVLLAAIAVAIGWRPQVSISVPVVIMLGLVAFTGLAFVTASIVDGLTSLALANALYIILLLLSGLVFDIEKMPGWLQAIVKLLPSTALAELLRSGFSDTTGAVWAWLCLSFWAIGAPILASRLFRWE